MKKAVIAIIIYFPLVLIYKLFGNPFNNYWVNAYWLAVSLVYILLFIGISNMFSLINLIHNNDRIFYKNISLAVSGYWLVMATIRLYLFFDIDKHREVICSAGKITTGSVCILFMFIFLMAKKMVQKVKDRIINSLLMIVTGTIISMISVSWANSKLDAKEQQKEIDKKVDKIEYEKYKDKDYEEKANYRSLHEKRHERELKQYQDNTDKKLDLIIKLIEKE